MNRYFATQSTSNAALRDLAALLNMPGAQNPRNMQNDEGFPYPGIVEHIEFSDESVGFDSAEYIAFVVSLDPLRASLAATLFDPQVAASRLRILFAL
jgi:hypothetical protein